MVSRIGVCMLLVAALLQCAAGQTAHVVGDTLGWLVPPGGSLAYSTWASTKTFTVGDYLIFNFTNGAHDVAEVTKAAYDACNSSSTIGSIIMTSPANITLNSEGEHYYICTFSQHCGLGQKLAINVTASSTASPPSTTPSPVPASAPVAPTIHVVGNTLGWLVPPGGSIAYSTWASTQTFRVGDSLLFNFTNGAHDVAEVTKAAYDACNTSNTIGSIIMTSPATIPLDSAGEHYYICTFSQHCSLGQKLAINVTGTATPPSSSAPSPSSTTTPPPPSIATPPSTSATPPSGSTSPPPTTGTPNTPSSAPSLAVAGFSVTFLSFAVAFLL